MGLLSVVNFTIGLFIFLFGVVIGSFLNVVVFRLPKGESIVTGPSHCMTCGHRLKWYELIPVLSYIIQGGKCRKCGARLSPQYPLVEAMNGVLWVLIWVWEYISTGAIDYVRTVFSLIPLYHLTDLNAADFAIDPTTLIGFGLVSALIAISIIDERTGIIPPGIVIFIAALGGARIIADYKNWYLYLIGGVVVSGFLFLLFLLTKGRGIGGGDIKLMAAAGLCLGWKGIILAFLIACIAGTIIHLIRMKVCKAGKKLAMGPYLSIGIMASYLVGDQIISWYISSMGL